MFTHHGWRYHHTLPSSPDLVPSNFHLFNPLREDLGGKRYRADVEVKHFVQECLDKQPQSFCVGHYEHAQAMMMMTTKYRVAGEYVKKQVLLFEESYQ